jgi:hypothetical protein
VPREKISIPLKTLPVYEASAVFFSTIAYPSPLDRTQRENFRIALSRRAVLERAKLDPEWRKNAQQIRPEIFSQEENHYFCTLERGGQLLRKRIFCAVLMITPQLTKGPVAFRRFSTTVEHMAGFVATGLGMKWGSGKTIEGRLWAPTKPIAHAAWALGRFELALWRQGEGSWEVDYWLLDHDLLLGSLFHASILSLLVETAERMRLHLATIKRFKIKEQDTVRFVLD